MIFTVRDALQLDALKDAVIVGGQQGLDREIQFVNVIEVPDIVNWISEHEFLLTTGYPFLNREINWHDFLKSLSEKNLAALALKVDRFIDEVPMDLIKAGDQLGIPILRLNYDAGFNRIIRDIIASIMKRDDQLIFESKKIEQIFTRLVISGGDLHEVLWNLATATSADVSLVNRDQVLMEEVLYPGRQLLDQAARRKPAANDEAAPSEPEEGSSDDRIPEAEGAVIEKTIWVDQEAEATLRIWKPDPEFSQLDHIAANKAVEAITLIILKKKAVLEIQRSYKYDFLNSLIEDRIQDRQQFEEKAKLYAIPVDKSFVLLIIDIRVFNAPLATFTSGRKELYPLISLFNSVFDTFFSKAPERIIWEHAGQIIVLYPVEEFLSDAEKPGSLKDKSFAKLLKERSKAFSNRLIEKVHDHFKFSQIRLGIGSFYPDFIDLGRSYKEAEEALRLGPILHKEDKVFHYDDLGIYKLFMKHGDKAELEAFVHEKLGPLLEHDEAHGTSYYETLKELFRNGFNLTVTAEALFLHPKSVSYRKKKIEELLGTSIIDNEEKMELYLAMKIYDLIRL